MKYLELFRIPTILLILSIGLGLIAGAELFSKSMERWCVLGICLFTIALLVKGSFLYLEED